MILNKCIFFCILFLTSFQCGERAENGTKQIARPHILDIPLFVVERITRRGKSKNILRHLKIVILVVFVLILVYPVYAYLFKATNGQYSWILNGFWCTEVDSCAHELTHAYQDVFDLDLTSSDGWLTVDDLPVEELHAEYYEWGRMFAVDVEHLYDLEVLGTWMDQLAGDDGRIDPLCIGIVLNRVSGICFGGDQLEGSLAGLTN